MKKIITVGAAIAVTIMALTGCSASSGTSAGSNSSASGNQAPADWAKTKYGDFAATTKSGTGDSVVPIPAGAKAGIVTATHAGSANFVIQVIDANNTPTIDLLVNTIGAYSGVSAFGMNAIGGPGTNLKVSADGAWTIAIAPIDSATILPASGTGNGVYLYAGKAASTALTHAGSMNFVVSEYTDSALSIPLLVNQIGAYSGSVPFLAGPAVVTITADGAWTTAAA